jgi:hypothetical protein
MAAPPIIKSAAHIPGASQMNQSPRTLDFLLSEAQGDRSRDVIQVTGPTGLWPGSLVDATGVAAATPAAIVGILAYATNPVDGPYNQTVIARDAEVIDAYLVYGALDPVATNAQLATLGIVVRAAVLPNTQPPSFAIDEPPTGPPVTGIQSAEEAPPPAGDPAPQTGRA